MKRIALRMVALTSFLCGNGWVHALTPGDNWEAYRSEVLKEQTEFSGWCPLKKAEDIMNIIHANHSRVCVELGVFGGSSFFPIAATLGFEKQGMAYAIDPWTNEACLEGYEEESEGKHQKYWGKVDLEKVMHKFMERMHKNDLDSTYVLMRMTSAQAHCHFEDESIDFLHIDGNHSEQSAVFDVEHWLSKVKKGGVICFDDAWWESTQPAIKILLKECDMMEESSSKWQYIFLRKR